MVDSLVDDAQFVTVNGAWTKTRAGFRDDGTQLALGGVVRHEEASVVDETGERGPEPELTLKRSAKPDVVAQFLSDGRSPGHRPKRT